MIREIETRRSIRKYSEKEVSKDTLKDLLKAAMHAPTARNLQEWRFVASNNREVLDKISTINGYQMLKDAKAVIVVCGDTNISNYEYVHVDCALATQNILLEATHLGLGACLCAGNPRKDRIAPLIEYLKLKENILPVAIISIGYPAEEKTIEYRYDENKITWL